MRVILLTITCLIVQSEIVQSSHFLSDQYLDGRYYKNKTCRELGFTTFLDLPELQISRIGRTFDSGVPLTCLNLRDNLISYIDTNAFTWMNNLTLLNLANNALGSQTMESLSSLKNLEILILDKNMGSSNILQMDNVFLPNLRHLHIEETGNIADINNNYDYGDYYYSQNLRRRSNRWRINLQMPKLTHLYLGHNSRLYQSHLEMLPKTLTHLYVDWNGFENFRIPQLKNLTTLSLDGNRFEVICRECSNNYRVSLAGKELNLEQLSLAYNKIKIITFDAFNGHRNLTYLNLSHNEINELSSGVFIPLINLQTLSLSYNQLKSVPNFCSAALLTDYDEPYTFSDPATCRLPALKELFLDNNMITLITGETFANFHSLEKLDLSNNPLAQLPSGWMESLPNLYSLAVRETPITSIDDLGLKEVRLTELDIMGSAIKTLSSQFLRNCNENLTIHI